MNRQQVSVLVITPEQEKGKTFAKKLHVNGWEGKVSILSNAARAWNDLEKSLKRGTNDHPRIIVLEASERHPDSLDFLEKIRNHPVLQSTLVVLIRDSLLPQTLETARQHLVSGLFTLPTTDSEWDRLASALTHLWNICEFV